MKSVLSKKQYLLLFKLLSKLPDYHGVSWKVSYSSEEACQLLGIARSTLHKYSENNVIPSIKIKGLRLYPGWIFQRIYSAGLDLSTDCFLEELQNQEVSE